MATEKVRESVEVSARSADLREERAGGRKHTDGYGKSETCSLVTGQPAVGEPECR